MGQILGNWRVFGALLFAAAVIGGTYLLGRSVDNPATASASAETALLVALASKDSTGDGLPDWQKALYGIPLDATTTDYFNLGMTDGEAVARGLIVPKALADVPAADAPAESGTLTDAFGKAFFTLYIAAKESNGGAPLSSRQQQALAEQALKDFIDNFTPSSETKRLSDLAVSGSGPAALSAYAAAAEAVFSQYESKTPLDEFKAVKDALEGDAGAASRVAAAERIYRQYAAGLSALAVPKELAPAALALVNAFYERAAIYDGIAKAVSDPLLGLVSVQELTKNEAAWMRALAGMGTSFSAANASLPDGAPGALFIRLAERLAAPSRP